MFKAKQKFTSILVACLMMIVSLIMAVSTLVVSPQTASAADTTEVTDVLNRATTGITKNSTNYASWSGKTANSTAVYAGQSAGDNDSIQLRSKNSNSGIFTTTSGGKATKITVDWNLTTTSGRTLDIYGKNTAYTQATDLYNSSMQGTKLGSIKCGTSTELTITGDYTYIGMRSNSGAMYLTSVSITWEVASSGGESSCEHKNQTTTTVDATCTVAGSKTVTCNDCGETVSTEEIPATGHNYVNGKCNVCGEKQPSEVTLTFDNTSKRTEFTTEQQVWQENGITVTNNKAESTTNVADYANPARFYKNSEVIVACAGMLKIVFNCTEGEEKLASTIGANATVADNVVTVVFDSAVDTWTVELSQAKVFVSSITVYIAEAEEEPAPVAKIDSASLTLGEDLTMNYYVTMSDTFASAKMYFTVDGYTNPIDPVEGKLVGERYIFSLNLAPQYMASNIKAELKFGEDVIASKDTYSIKEYAQNKLNATESSTELKQLITDLLYYGNAAQTYKNFNTENLATDGVTNLGSVDETRKPERNWTITTAQNPVWFSAAGVHFNNVNQLYVRLKTQEDVTLENVILKISCGGEVVKEVAVTEAITVYTDAILATNFAMIYKFDLYVGGTLTQTLTYSVNDYAYEMQNDGTMSALALALYRYGKSAYDYKYPVTE